MKTRALKDDGTDGKSSKVFLVSTQAPKPEPRVDVGPTKKTSAEGTGSGRCQGHTNSKTLGTRTRRGVDGEVRINAVSSATPVQTTGTRNVS